MKERNLLQRDCEKNFGFLTPLYFELLLNLNMANPIKITLTNETALLNTAEDFAKLFTTSPSSLRTTILDNRIFIC